MDRTAIEKQIARYRVGPLLARGGMGAVYEAVHLESGRSVALKVIERQLGEPGGGRQRFLREARAMDRVRHPHVVQVFDVGMEDGRPFIAMELLRGETLAARLAREGRLPLSALVECFAAITAAVAAIHDAGILHRDLKLGNVMLTRRGGATLPVVLDFGISKTLAEDAEDAEELTLTHSEALLGTPRYLSPEQTLNSKAASRLSDQYAIGVMLYECASGARPFVGSSPYEVMHAILTAELPAPSTLAPGLPASFDRLVARAMSRDAAARFPDVRALGAALLELADDATRARFTGELTHASELTSFDADQTEQEQRRLPTLRPLTVWETRGRVARATLPPWSFGALLVGAAAVSLVWIFAPRPGGTSPTHAPPREPREPAPAVAPEVPVPALAEPSAPTLEAPSAGGRDSARPSEPPGAAASTTFAASPHRPAPAVRSQARVRSRPAAPSVPSVVVPGPTPQQLGRDDAIDPFETP